MLLSVSQCIFLPANEQRLKMCRCCAPPDTPGAYSAPRPLTLGTLVLGNVTAPLGGARFDQGFNCEPSPSVDQVIRCLQNTINLDMGCLLVIDLTKSFGQIDYKGRQ